MLIFGLILGLDFWYFLAFLVPILGATLQKTYVSGASETFKKFRQRFGFVFADAVNAWGYW